jgi:hypothetical protein
MKSNIFKPLTLLLIFVLLLLGCNGSRYAQGGAHNHGVNNSNYRGY